MGSYNADIPYRKFAAIVPSNSVDNIALGCNAVYVGGAGNISMVGQDGVAVVFTAAPVGAVLRCGPVRVNATLTTATLLLALY